MFVAFAASPSKTWTRVGALLVLALFCLPLFFHLGEQDLRNDEAIYSYAVDRVLDTGDWLTPRAIPFDGPFLEKPPLKVWMVAGLMRAGVLPRDERGMRFVDALFGALAFLYVYALGARYAGPICGAIAVFVLFLFEPLLIDHGLRSNNMEAALLLAYCGGMYHVARWREEVESRRGAPHAYAVGAFVALGFMTKFVAVLFLPLVCVLALLWQREARVFARMYWRDWIGPAGLAVAVCAPWFAYQWLHAGQLLWNVMFGQHIYTRFTGALDPDHLEPWTFYIVEIWNAFAKNFTQWIVAGGVAVLAARAWTGQPWLARLLLVWLIVPLGLISMGTSKLFHYAYPVLPPLAIAAGALVAMIVTALDGWLASAMARMETPRVRALRIGVFVLAMALMAWPLYEGALEPLAASDHPLRTIRDCAVRVQRSHTDAGRSVYNAARTETGHPFFYYLRHLGPWTFAEAPEPDEVRRHLSNDDRQSLVIVARDDFPAVALAVIADREPARGVARASLQPSDSRDVIVGAISPAGVIIVLPGPYQACIGPAVMAGWRAVGERASVD